MQKLAYVLTLASAFVVSVGLSSPAAHAAGAAVPAGAVCVVYDQPLLQTSVDEIIDQARRNYRVQKMAFPAVGSPEYEMLLRQTTDYLIEQMLFERAAKRLGITVEDSAVMQRLADLKQSFFKGDEQAYLEELDKQGLTEAQVIENIRQGMLSEAVFNRVTMHVRTTVRQARAYYHHNRASYAQAKSREVAHILVQRKGRAWQIFWQAYHRSEAVFFKLARKHSTDESSAADGGVLTVSQGQTVPEFDRVAFRLRTGGMSMPLKTQFGWHIIRALTPVTPAESLTFSQVRAQIRSQLDQEARSRAMQGWREDVRVKAVVSCIDGYVWEPGPEATPAFSLASRQHIFGVG